jgi:hypothetical protein
MVKEGESLAVGWCDNGSTDSLFTSSFGSFLLASGSLGIKEIAFSQTIGNQIARQRGDAIKEFERTNFDWLLWVDSDIVIDFESFKLLWQNRDAEKAPLISGVYFVSMEPNTPLMLPVPCIFTDDGVKNTPIHPLPYNQLIDIDVAGLGFCLMHKSVAKKLRDAYGNTTFDITIDDVHKSEDISFFRKCKALNIPIKAHTGALVQHIKRFVVDINYYNHWWNTVAPIRKRQNALN